LKRVYWILDEIDHGVYKTEISKYEHIIG